MTLEDQVFVPRHVELDRVPLPILVHAEVAAPDVPQRFGLVLILAAVAPRHRRRPAAPRVQTLLPQLTQPVGRETRSERADLGVADLVAEVHGGQEGAEEDDHERDAKTEAYASPLALGLPAAPYARVQGEAQQQSAAGREEI